MAQRNNLGHLLNETFETHEDGGIEWWRDVPGYVGLYRVSDWGRLKALARWRVGNGGSKYLRKEKFIQIKPNRYGYVEVALYNHLGVCKYVKVHQLVLLAFVEPCPDGMQCRHSPDSDKTNNRLENLQWGTAKQNKRDQYIQNEVTIIKGEQHPFAKLTEQDVLNIRVFYNSGDKTLLQLSQIFGVSTSSVGDVVKGITWKHVGGPIYTSDGHACGERQHLAKLTTTDIIHIRELHASGGYTYKSLSDKYGVTLSSIRSIVLKHSWKHVE